MTHPLHPRRPLTLAAAILLFGAAGCKFGPGPEGRDGDAERRLQAVTRMKSSALKPLAKAASSGWDRCEMGYPCITPLNLEGRIFSGNLMVGGNGGPPGAPLRVVEGYDTSRHGAETGRGGSLKFNLGTTTDLDGAYACCPSSYPPDDLAKIHRLEFLFDYLDATFQVPADAATPLAGKTFTIRTVYVDTGAADDLAGGKAPIFRGDKLIRKQGETGYRWCTAAGCDHATRPSVPLRTAWHAETGASTAYPHYFTVGINLKTPMSFTLSEATRGRWGFTVDWDLARAVRFATSDFAMLTTEAELVAAFDLLSGHGGPGGIGVDVDLTKTMLDSAWLKAAQDPTDG